MESYVEITFINNVFIMMTSTLAACYLMVRSLPIKQLILYSAVISFACVSLWSDVSWWLIIILELGCVWFIFRDALNIWLTTLALRLMMSLTCWVLYGGSFHLTAYFVPAGAWMILNFWIIMIVLLAAMLLKWKYFLSQSTYVYRSYLYIQNKKRKMNAYLDSGNMLMSDQVPVIFLSGKYYEYLKNENIELIVMNTMNSTSAIRAYACELQVHGYQRHKVYACCDTLVKIPMNCSCLLNIHDLITG